MEELNAISCKDPIVQVEFQEFMESMSMGKFFMEAETFRTIVENRKKYFPAKDKAFILMDNEMKKERKGV